MVNTHRVDCFVEDICLSSINHSVKAPAQGFVTPILVLSHTPEALFDNGVEVFHGTCDPRSSIR
ncbi:hypothetical protein PISMIDRAFT_684750 [Pisolithus microcarpus 441]|uniref:Uncharacterized protein n=1 Tax=Pisolithus microcarpus 441 TaxID=765257 RepID=A0A0C9Z696_9AGAM|nr:hypothetical protein PISMIDRAFT_684750 [Pisolithus microcarpus 441]